MVLSDVRSLPSRAGRGTLCPNVEVGVGRVCQQPADTRTIALPPELRDSESTTPLLTLPDNIGRGWGFVPNLQIDEEPLGGAENQGDTGLGSVCAGREALPLQQEGDTKRCLCGSAARGSSRALVVGSVAVVGFPQDSPSR